MARALASYQLEAKLTADQRGGALQRLERHIALVRIEDSVDLGATGVHQLGETLFSNALLFHLAFELQGDYVLDRRRGCLLLDTLLFKEIVKRRTPMRIFGFGHRFISLIRLRANSRSPTGVFWVFLMKPWSTPIRPSWKKKSKRAILPLGSELRTSHKPEPSGRQ